MSSSQPSTASPAEMTKESQPAPTHATTQASSAETTKESQPAPTPAATPASNEEHPTDAGTKPRTVPKDLWNITMEELLTMMKEASDECHRKNPKKPKAPKSSKNNGPVRFMKIPDEIWDRI